MRLESGCKGWQVIDQSSSIANPATADAQLHIGNTAAIHLIVLQGDGVVQADAGGQVLFDTPGGLNEIDPTVNNAGTVALVAGSDISLGGTINNNGGGVFDLRTDSGISGGTFNNGGGTLQKSAGGGTSTLSYVTLTNSSTIDGQSGTLDLNVTGTNRGAINREAGATVKLGGTWALSAGSSFNGSGTTVAYGTLNVMGNVTAATDLTADVLATGQARSPRGRSAAFFDPPNQPPGAGVHRGANTKEDVEGGRVLVPFEVADVFTGDPGPRRDLLLSELRRPPSLSQLRPDHRDGS